MSTPGKKFAIDAIAAGKQGAVSLHRWVQDATLTIGRDKREFIELDKNNLLLEEASYDNTPRQRIGYNETLRKTFKDGRVAFTEEQVKAETARCLAAAPAWWTPISASAAASAPPAVPLMPSTCTVTCRSAALCARRRIR